MGMWDYEAWDNDSAADWFGDLMDATNLRSKWLEGIKSDLEDEFEVARAALWLFVQLGRLYVWPIENYNDDLELAITVGEQITSLEWVNEEIPEYVLKVKSEVEQLKGRRK